VEIWLTDIAVGQDYALALRDSDEDPPADWYSRKPGNQDEYIKVTAPAGRYFVQVYNETPIGSNQAYHLRVDY
jgi:hypothetical protein